MPGGWVYIMTNRQRHPLHRRDQLTSPAAPGNTEKDW